MKIQTGQITLIPICNPKAYEADKRYYEVNLNRIFKKHANPEKYEEKLANVLTAYVENNDYLLDLHSMAANGVPCIFEDYMDKKTQEWVKKI
ncbi:MAG: succinylglutamate desuccinylase/aspartoacylase family protein [bacterium]